MLYFCISISLSWFIITSPIVIIIARNNFYMKNILWAPRKVSPWSSGWPGSCFVAQTGLPLMEQSAWIKGMHHQGQLWNASFTKWCPSVLPALLGAGNPQKVNFLYIISIKLTVWLWWASEVPLLLLLCSHRLKKKTKFHETHFSVVIVENFVLLYSISFLFI